MGSINKSRRGTTNSRIAGSASAIHVIWKQEELLCHQARLRYAACLIFLAATPCAWGQVAGGQVTSGSAQIKQSGGTTTITQSTETASINWKTFNVGVADVVTFNQPSRQSLTINRIADTNGSTILGRINANGQVWLINPNGVLFGQGAQINVGAILASALAVADPLDNRSTGPWSIEASGDSVASVTNHGQIRAAEDGYVALLAHRVSNTGSISAPSGAIVLGGGSVISIPFQNNKVLGIEISRQQLDAMVGNSGLMNADGGSVSLVAGARASLLASAVNNSGKVQARNVSMQQGKIVLSAGANAGRVVLSGSVDASAPTNGDGGRIEVSAAHLQLADGWQADASAMQGRAGSIELEAARWSVQRSVAPGSDNTLSNDGVSKLLAANNLTLSTHQLSSESSDIALNGAVVWNSPTTLSLRALGDVQVNDVLTASHAQGALHIGYGLASADGVIAGKQASYRIGAPVSLRAGPNLSTQLGASGAVKAYTVITALGSAGSTTGIDLQGISQAPDKLTKNYALGADIAASETATWNNRTGFKPLFSGDAQTDINSFQGTFEGLGHVITGLTINKPSAGVQSFITALGKSGVIQNLGLRDIAYDSNNTGGIVFRNFGLIRNSFVDGGYVKAGENFKNLSNFIGGLAGSNVGQIINSYANVTVSMNDSFGSYRTDANFNYKAGGLVGSNGGTIVNSYAKGQVFVSDRIASSTTPVIYGGGLVGSDVSTGGIVSSYWIQAALSSVPAVGSGGRAVTQAIGQRNTANATPDSSYLRNAVQASSGQTFSDWDLTGIWLLYEGHGTPYLRGFMTPLYVNVANPAQKVYDGNLFIDVASSTVPPRGAKNLWGDLVGSLSNKNAGVQDVSATGLYSDQAGYQVRYEYQQPTVLVVKAPLHINGITAKDKEYDGSSYAVLDATGVKFDGLIKGDDVSANFSGNFATADAGAGKRVLLAGEIAGSDQRNYETILQSETIANITKPAQIYIADPPKPPKSENPGSIAITAPALPVNINDALIPAQVNVPTTPKDSTLPVVYDKFDKYAPTQRLMPVPTVVYDKYDKYALKPSEGMAQAVQKISALVPDDVIDMEASVQGRNVRTESKIDSTFSTSAVDSRELGQKPEDPTEALVDTVQKKKNGSPPQTSRVSANPICVVSLQGLWALPEITCQTRSVFSGK